MARTITRIPNLPSDSGVNLALLAMAADIAGTREGAEMLAQCAEELLAQGDVAEAVDWFARIVEGGEPELGPHAALRIGAALVDTDPEATRAAFRYAADHGRGRVAEAAAGNLRTLARHDAPARTAPATADEVAGRAALGRGRLWAAEGDLEAARAAFEQAASCPVADVAAAGLAYLGSTLTMLGDPDTAAVTLERAMATGHPRYGAMAATDLSAVLAARGEHGRALEALRWARDGEGPAASMAAVHLGLLLAGELGDLDGGLAELRRVAAGPDPMAAAGAAFNLGVLLEDHGDLDGARDAYRRSADLREPLYSGKAALNLGVLLSKASDVRGTHAALTLAVEIGDADDRESASEMLARLALLGDLDEAHERIAAAGPEAIAQAQGPDGVGSASLRLAEHALEQGDLQGAIRLYERAMDTGHPVHAPKGAAAVALMFSSEAGRHGAETAIARLDEVGFGALRPRAWFFFGGYMVRRGDLREAAAAWRRISEAEDTGAHAAAACVLPVLDGASDRAADAFPRLAAHAAELVSEAIWTIFEIGEALSGKRRTRAAGRRANETALLLAERSGDPDLAGNLRRAHTR
jgi:tetratricopeptide (TPR) repeat protein